jgi:hypothetical protein
VRHTQPAADVTDTCGMPRPLHSAFALALALQLCACFRGLDAVGAEPGAASSVHTVGLQVQDARGAVWPAEQAPRAPIFVLQFADGAPKEPARHVWLLRGTAGEALLSDLHSAQRRATTEARQVALTTVREGRRVVAQPTRPLEPGARYTLVWAEAAASLAFPLVVSRGPAAGARLAHSLPAALEAQVPPNLAHALLHFDGYLAGDVRQHVLLLDAAGSAVPAALRSAACAELGLGAGDCVSITPQQELRAGERYQLSIQGGLQDVTGAPIRAQEIAFETAGEPDTRAPAWLGLDCARDELARGPVCVLTDDTRAQVRARADENGLLTLAGGGGLAASPGNSGEYLLELPLQRSLSALLQLRDLAGNTAQLMLALEPALALASIAIDELRVDPLGPEASQEYVELLNFGDAPMSIADFSLSDDAFAVGQRVEGRPTLAAGERALVVPAGFDAGDARDQAPAAGVRLLRLAGPLPLRNEGSALFLRDARGRRVSAAPALAPDQPGQCSARLADAEPRSGASATFALDPTGGCTPGYATDWTAGAASAP